MMLVKHIVDLVTRRPKEVFEVESARMELDEVTIPTFQRVLDELAILEQMFEEKRKNASH